MDKPQKGQENDLGTQNLLGLEKAAYEGGSHRHPRVRGQAPGCRTRTAAAPGPSWPAAVQNARRRLQSHVLGRHCGDTAACAGSPIPSPGARRTLLQRTLTPSTKEPKATGSEGRDRNRLTNRKWVV